MRLTCKGGQRKAAKGNSWLRTNNRSLLSLLNESVGHSVERDRAKTVAIREP
jgi:hypothetical protein